MIKMILGLLFTLLFSTSVLSADSLVTIKSNHTVKVTADRFENIIKQKGLTVFARINHAENAANVSLDLDPTEVIIFGSPKVGTPLMQCSKTVAIDLPQKALFWQDVAGQAWLSYNNPEYLKERHGIKGCDHVISKISNVLSKLSKAATLK